MMATVTMTTRRLGILYGILMQEEYLSINRLTHKQSDIIAYTSIHVNTYRRCYLSLVGLQGAMSGGKCFLGSDL